MFPSSPRHALLSLAIATAGFLGPWVLGGSGSVETDVQVSAQLPPLRVAHVVLPQQSLELHSDALEISDETPTIDARDTEDAPSTSPDTAKKQLAGATALASKAGAGPHMRIEAVDMRPGNGPTTKDGGKAERKAAKPGRKRKKRTRQECLPEREDVAQVSDLAYRIEDATVYHYANHPREAEALAATWWSKDDDKEINGFKVGRLRCGSLLDVMGFKNGDVISGVNGLEIKTYGDAINAYMTLRRKRILWVDVDRRGEPVRLDFVLVGEGEAGLELAEDDPLAHPSALVDEELAAEDLPWLRRVVKKRKLRRITR